MDIGLFDIYTNGHHLPYAAKTKRAIEAQSDHNVQFITLSETPRCARLFDAEDIIYIDSPDSPRIEERDTVFSDVAEGTIERLFRSDLVSELDVLQFLFADDILAPLYRHHVNKDSIKLVGEINGVFFERKVLSRQWYVFPILWTILRSPARQLVNGLVPEYTDHDQLWRDLFLYRCLSENVFDDVIVHSIEANDYVSTLRPAGSTPVTHIPYPAPDGFGVGISKQEARSQLGLPHEDTILLFFGSLRDEKGIDRLLRVLERYDGPRFTMHIAGPPTDVTEEQVLATKRVSKVDIIPEIQYIDSPEVYFRASDAIVLPYSRKFGEECTSQTLEEATSALRPVIVPGFGAIGRVTEEWSLGITYQQDSDRSLEQALTKCAEGEISYSIDRMKEYNNFHSYEKTANRLIDLYERQI